MNFLSTSAFCCYMSLRTGGILIGFLSFLFAVSNIVTHSHAGDISSYPITCAISAINALLWLGWLFGIYKKQTIWMAPAFFINTTANVIYSIFYSLLVLTQLCIGAIMIFMLNTFYEESIMNLHSESAIVLWLSILSTWCAVQAACYWHMSAVNISLFRIMKEDERIDAKLKKMNGTTNRA